MNKDVYERAGGYLSTRDVADDLGLDISTVWQFIKEGILPATNVGDGNYRPRYGVLLQDLNEFKKIYVKYATRISNPKKPGRKPKPKDEVKEVKVDKNKEEIESLKKEMALMAEKLLEISVRLDELSKS